MSYLNC